ncbi:transcriptional regulator, HxlR family [Palleronia marisminoris]|uniref:HTH-type transcriptional regulator YodB n=1 Tax=Palleronia marisminoris TaxID=315423 RepID=A0A1Y5TSE8_9RHOB|nr:helix-turn-helix domain-containing protein [Palleronia marisminoris]SFH47153.1 transcriptional regulator, HxlR family [Palleronia marisminoris]SLN68549.1 HTH-type transcriptional regulator YodB [Palleronia marisminoris]
MPEAGPHGRWYQDACGTAFGLELLGERWSLLIVRELMFGPKRFSDIRANLPGISAKVLTERLSGLEASGVIIRTTAPEPTPAQLYGLTEWGHEAEPIIRELGRWAAASPLHDPTLPLSPASFMLSLRTMMDAEAARDMEIAVVFSIGTAQFTARLANGAMPVERGETEAPDLHFEAPSAPPLAAVFYGEAEPDAVSVRVIGDPELRRTFTALFNLPRPHPLARSGR